MQKIGRSIGEIWMSSKPETDLCNLGYAEQYEAILSQNLPESFTQFSDFFSGLHRLETLGNMLITHFKQKNASVLNVGSGPFASEIFVNALQQQNIVAIDYTPEFAPFHGLFRKDGHLLTTEFEQADAMAIEFAVSQFDLIVLHDVLYEPALDLEKLTTRLQTYLKPGGLIFIDFVNSRTRWIWKLMGKPEQFRRYDPNRVKAFLGELGFEIVDWRPTHRSKSTVVSMLHIILWYGFRASNNYAFLARKKVV
jgi:SAM-dependent methyltransferase